MDIHDEMADMEDISTKIVAMTLGIALWTFGFQTSSMRIFASILNRTLTRWDKITFGVLIGCAIFLVILLGILV